MTKNKYGLSRNIPARVKAKVRANCGFGCVICGQIPVDYDHLYVPFSEAREHNPEDIVLLCAHHHRLKTNGVLDSDQISHALRTKMGACSETRFKLDITDEDFRINWCGTEIQSTENVIQVDRDRILNFEVSENPLEPLILSGKFRDCRGQIICKIEKNEFVFRNPIFGDISLFGNNFRYVDGNGETSLVFKLEPGLIDISKIFHIRNDCYVFGNGASLNVGNSIHRIELIGCKFVDVRTAIHVESCVDDFIHAQENIENKPANQLCEVRMQGGGCGVKVGGIKRPNRYHDLKREYRESTVLSS